VHIRAHLPLLKGKRRGEAQHQGVFVVHHLLAQAHKHGALGSPDAARFVDAKDAGQRLVQVLLVAVPEARHIAAHLLHDGRRLGGTQRNRIRITGGHKGRQCIARLIKLQVRGRVPFAHQRLQLGILQGKAWERRRRGGRAYQQQSLSRLVFSAQAGRTDERDGEAVDEEQRRDAVVRAAAHKVEVAQKARHEEREPHTQPDGAERHLRVVCLRNQTVSSRTWAQRGEGDSAHALVMVNSVSATSSLPVADANTTIREALHLLFTRNTARCGTPCSARRAWRTPARCCSGAGKRQAAARPRRRWLAADTLATSGAALNVRILWGSVL
jgi:hypothetical protein